MNQEALLTDFQELNMRPERYINLLYDKVQDRRIPLGVTRNSFEDVTGAWYFDGKGRVFLNMRKLEYIRRLPGSERMSPALLWIEG